MGLFAAIRKIFTGTKRALTKENAHALIGNELGEHPLNNPTVYKCVHLIADMLSVLSLHMYRDGPDRQPAKEHRYYSLVHRRPNPSMTSATFIKVIAENLLLWGNAYLYLTFDEAGRVTGMYPIKPSIVQVDVAPNGVKSFKIQGNTYTDYQIGHIVGYSDDGYVGAGVISRLRNLFSADATVRKFADRYFERGASLGAIVEMPGSISSDKNMNQDQKDQLRAKLKADFQGVKRAGDVGILENGWKYTELSIKAADAELLATRKFSAEDIAGVFRVPLSLIGMGDKSSYAKSEYDDISLLKHTLLPWIIAIQQGLNYALFGTSTDLFVEFDVNSILRGTLKERFDGYKVALESGWMSRNEVRRLENLPPIKGLDSYLVPLNQGVAQPDGSVQPHKGIAAPIKAGE